MRKDFQANKIAAWPFPKSPKDPEWPFPTLESETFVIQEPTWLFPLKKPKAKISGGKRREDKFVQAFEEKIFAEKPILGVGISTIDYKSQSAKYPLLIEDANKFIQEKDPNGKSLNSMGAKGDAGKNRAWLCLAGFSNAFAKVAEVTTFGANKYTPNGWTEVPDASNRYMDAFGRHMLKLGANETYDKESGCKHLAQMIWNLLAVLELEERNESHSR